VPCKQQCLSWLSVLIQESCISRDAFDFGEAVIACVVVS